MYNLTKDDYDENVEDIMASINKLLNKKGSQYVIESKEENKEEKGK